MYESAARQAIVENKRYLYYQYMNAALAITRQIHMERERNDQKTNTREAVLPVSAPAAGLSILSQNTE